jgi:hypothetical protein
MPNLHNKYICLKPYNALFPKDNENYPCKKVKSYLHIEKQCGNKLWGMNYWKLYNAEDYNSEFFTGFIKKNGNIVLVEDNPQPVGGSTGVLELEPICDNQYDVFYLGIGQGISFTTTGVVRKNK